MTTRRYSSLAGILLISGLTLCAADSPYVGKWKSNPAKSDFKETTITFGQPSPGELQFTADGMTYNFKLDGKDSPSFFGQTAAWKEIDKTTWQSVDKLNGKILSTETYKLSADGKTLTMESKGTTPKGEPFNTTVGYQRVSGGPGLAGKWKTTQVKASKPTLLEFAPNGDDGLTLTLVDFQATCSAKFDGKDYPATGPTVPPNFTLAIQKAGPRSFDMIEKQNGKTLFKVTYTVSDDGKTMTEVGGSVATNEKMKIVYDRQ